MSLPREEIRRRVRALVEEELGQASSPSQRTEKPQAMSEPTKELKSLIDSQLIGHGGHPALRWMAANAVVIMDDAENIKLSKKKSGAKIDGMIGAIMAIGRAMIPDDTPGPSVYESRGVLTF